MNHSRRTPASFASRSLAFLAVFAMQASACQICLPFPTDSLADRILAAEHLVLARENPDQPYTLGITRILEGGDPPPLELFLDSSSRRWLSFGEDRAILCGWFPEEGGWRSLARHDELLAPVVRDILKNRQAWQDEPGARVRYFADLLGHEDNTLADLAHLEVARAPYREITHYADRLSRQELLKELGNPRRMEWHALYILMLAQSDHPDDHQLIHDKLERNAHWGFSLQTAAWATALIEIDGPAGIERLSELYLSETEREPVELAAIHAALRVHGDQGSSELRDPVVAAYGRLLERAPALAPELADDLTKWNRFDHADAFTSLLKNGEVDLLGTTRIRAHLRADREAASVSPDGRRDGLILSVIVGLLLLAVVAPLTRKRPKSALAPSTDARRPPPASSIPSGRSNP